jgi:hypothetical protein
MSSKHMFQNNASSGGTSFIGQIALGSAPASMSFTQMPQAQSGTTVTFSPNSGAVSTEFGDCLFFAAYDTPQTIGGVIYTSPITVAGANVTDSQGKAVTMNIDVYRFYYEYLSSTGDLKKVANLTSYWLMEWQSVQFLDAFELTDIASTDTVLQQSVIKWLTTGANFPSGNPITLAWDPTQTQMTNGSGANETYAFWTLSGSAITGVSNPSGFITMQNYTPLSRTSSGLISNFNYGISGNYSNLAGDPPPPNVPQFAPPNTTATAFPGGFEVGMQGANGGVQVMIRSLLIARGNNKGIVWDNETSVSSVRDVW